jgi:hypothetical protein
MDVESGGAPLNAEGQRLQRELEQKLRDFRSQIGRYLESLGAALPFEEVVQADMPERQYATFRNYKLEVLRQNENLYKETYDALSRKINGVKEWIERQIKEREIPDTGAEDERNISSMDLLAAGREIGWSIAMRDPRIHGFIFVEFMHLLAAEREQIQEAFLKHQNQNELELQQIERSALRIAMSMPRDLVPIDVVFPEENGLYYKCPAFRALCRAAMPGLSFVLAAKFSEDGGEPGAVPPGLKQLREEWSVVTLGLQEGELSRLAVAAADLDVLHQQHPGPAE